MEERQINKLLEDGDASGILMGAMVARLQGLMDILEELEVKSDLQLSQDQMPYLEAQNEEGAVYFFSYIPVDITGEFILQIAREVTEEGIDAETILINIASFNMGSEFGFAVYDPFDGTTVLRAQVPEQGGISLEWYSYILGLFNDSFAELADTLSISDSDED